MKIILLILSIIAVYLILGLLFVRLVMWPVFGDPTSYDSLYNGLKHGKGKNNLLTDGCEEMERTWDDIGLVKRTVVLIAEIVWTIGWIFLLIIWIVNFIRGLFATKD